MDPSLLMLNKSVRSVAEDSGCIKKLLAALVLVNLFIVGLLGAIAWYLFT